MLPSPIEAQNLACVRNQIANLLELSINYVDKQTILDRYRFLMDEKDRKGIQQKNESLKSFILSPGLLMDYFCHLSRLSGVLPKQK